MTVFTFDIRRTMKPLSLMRHDSRVLSSVGTLAVGGEDRMIAKRQAYRKRECFASQRDSLELRGSLL